MRVKKMTSILLILSLMLGLTACGSTGAASSTSAETAQSEAVAEDAAEPAGNEPAEETAIAEEAEPDVTINPAGGYKLTKLTTENGSDLEAVSTVVGMGANYYLILEEEGTGKMNFLEAEIPLTWDESSLTIESTRQGQNVRSLKLPYTYADGLLKIDTRAYSMEFTSLTDTELADYSLNGAASLPGMLKKAISPLLGNLDDLASTLFFLLAAGAGDGGREPIPEGKPSKGIVNGRLGDLEINIVGTAHKKGDEDNDLLVIYFDVTNHSESEVISTWGQVNIDTMQDGEWLEEVYDYEMVPEALSYNLGIAPGMTLRCAESYQFDPEGGVAGFRFTSRYADGSILYYADPANPVAPAKPFVIGAEPWSASFLKGVPEENKDLRLESVDFITDEDGQLVLEVYLHYVNSTGTDGKTFFDDHGTYALQDGIGLAYYYGMNAPEEQGNGTRELAAGEEILVYRSYLVRTDSPVAFVVFNDSTEQRLPEIAKIIEVVK